MQYLIELMQGIQAMSGWEYLAVTLGVAYLVLAMRQSLWCWPAAFASTLVYTLLFFNGALLMESALNVYYMGMAFYGWFNWRNGGVGVNTDELEISSFSLRWHMWAVLLTGLLSLAIGYFMDTYTYADLAYLDATTTCFSVLTTYLVAKKVLENWIYWVAIDSLSIYLYVSKDYLPTAMLFTFYTLMALWGYWQWKSAYQQQLATES